MTQETASQYSNTVTFAVADMTCGSCVKHVREALDENFDQLSHEIDLANKKLTVSFEPTSVSEEAIARVLGEAGYPATKL